MGGKSNASKQLSKICLFMKQQYIKILKACELSKEVHPTTSGGKLFQIFTAVWINNSIKLMGPGPWDRHAEGRHYLQWFNTRYMAVGQGNGQSEYYIEQTQLLLVDSVEGFG